MISIIIPYLKYEHYLIECLESLKEQVCKDFEVIIVYSDELPKENLIEKYGKFFEIKVIEKHNENVAAARNEGLRQAKGEYILFLDSDDYIDEHFIDNMKLRIDDISDIICPSVTEVWYKKETVRTVIANGGGVAPVKRKNFFSKKTTIDKASLLGALIKKDLLENNNIEFDECLDYAYSFDFCAKIISCHPTIITCESSCYFKRFHNDPINMPSLSQDNLIDKVKEYDKTVEKYADTDNEELKEYVHNLSLNYFKSECEKNIFSNKLSENQIPNILKIASTSNSNAKALLKGKKKKFKVKKAVRTVLGKRSRYNIVNVNKRFQKKAKRIVKYFKLSNIKKRFYKLGYRMFKIIYSQFLIKIPIKENVILFETFFGKSYSDSPKYIYEYLQKNYPDKFKCVFSVKSKKTEIPYGCKKVRRFFPAYFYYAAVSKFFVFNVRQPIWMKKREGQVFLETWHGTPLKKLFFDIEEVMSANPLNKLQIYEKSRDWDYLISPNRFSTDVFESCFMFDRDKIIETGYPRNDPMHSDHIEEDMEKIKEKLNLPKDKKIILYAPTWRDDEFYGSGKYKFTLKLDLQKMQEELSDDYIVILRTHYYIADIIDISEFEGFAYNFSKYPDIVDLYLVSDILITDYSSVFFDYAGLKRPMLFFTYDIAKYRDTLRGFYFDIEKEVPGPLLFTTDEIIDSIKNIDDVTVAYKEKYEQFYEKFCSLENGTSAKKVTDIVFFNKRNDR